MMPAICELELLPCADGIYLCPLPTSPGRGDSGSAAVTAVATAPPTCRQHRGCTCAQRSAGYRQTNATEADMLFP